MTGKYITGKEDLKPKFFMNVNAISLRTYKQIQYNRILKALFAITSRIYPRNYEVFHLQANQLNALHNRTKECGGVSCTVISNYTKNIFNYFMKRTLRTMSKRKTQNNQELKIPN